MNSVILLYLLVLQAERDQLLELVAYYEYELRRERGFV